VATSPATSSTVSRVPAAAPRCADEPGLRQQHAQHVPTRHADRAHHADLLSALDRTHQHDVEDRDAGDDERDGTEPEQEGAQEIEEVVDLVDDRGQLEQVDALFADVHRLADRVRGGSRRRPRLRDDQRLCVAVGGERRLREEDGVVGRDRAERLALGEHGDDADLRPRDPDGVARTNLKILGDPRADDRARRWRSGSLPSAASNARPGSSTP